ncbi:Hypothetical protein, putative [Bodo saltans]|uniref:Uncharacterized protein n=1 Tax=Bodo saltans TaxID=75058 RepID=A0A0S4IWS1_BODSA|nr:Hypothetical protein, putative [Bodo saltans]|eukprot:CUG06031.1 Hypothetical protein, putative [Bodo saltans]
MSILDKIQGAVRTASPDRARCATPLRPSAGLVGRISQEDLNETKNNSFADVPFAVTAASGGKKPQRPPLHLRATASSSHSNNGVTTSTDNAALIAAAAEQNFTLHESPSEDAYSLHEKNVVSEINLLRGDPTGYAALVERDATVSRPYVPAPMPLGTLVRYSEELQIQRDNAQEKLDDLANQKKKEIATLNTEWVTEDLEKAKKAKKGAPKKGATPDPEMDPERLEVLQQLEKKFFALQRDLSKTFETTSAAFSGATQGIKVIRDCMTKLRQLQYPLPSLQYNRGLSLAAREICTHSLPAAQITTQELRSVARKFGEVGERALTAQHSGVATIRQTIMEMLMGVQEVTKKTSRSALLDPTLTFVGCGWRKQRPVNNAPVSTVLLLTSGFEELDAIFSRPHMPLDGVRRMLPNDESGNSAKTSRANGNARVAALAASARGSLISSTPPQFALASSSSSTGATAASSNANNNNGHSTIVKLQTQLDITLVSPVSHPLVCGNEAVVLFHLGGEDIRLCAMLLGEHDPAPSTPSAGAGDVFIQHTVDEGIVELRAVLPCKGIFRLVMFARSILHPSSPYKNIGSVRLVSSKWHSSKIQQPYPLVTSDFDDRRCTLIGPMEGQLQAGCLYTFELVIPLSSYLRQDIDRIDHTLQATMTRYGVTPQTATNFNSTSGGDSSHVEDPRRAAAAAKREHDDADYDQGSPLSDDHAGSRTSEPGGARASSRQSDRVSSAPPPVVPSSQQSSPLELLEQELAAAELAVELAKKKQADDSPVIANDIATQTRELGKKKGKDQDRVKAQIAEWEEQLSQLVATVQAAEKRVAGLQERMVNQRRAQKRAAAQILRFQREKEKFEEAADRRGPLRVQLSLEERRADFRAIDHEYTVYRLETRMPREAGPITLFINGLAVVMYTVVE